MLNTINYNTTLVCVNKRTFESVEIPIPGGLGGDFRQSVLKFAAEWSGQWNAISGPDVKPTFDYYYLKHSSVDNSCITAIKMRSVFDDKHTGTSGKRMVVFHVDPLTHKFIIDEEHQKVLDEEGIKDIYKYITPSKLC